MYYFLDIETRPNYKLVDLYKQNIKPPVTYKTEKAINKWEEKRDKELKKWMSVDQDFSKIVCIWVLDWGGNSRFMTLKQFNKFIIEEIIKNNWILVTFNWKAFDLPILLKNGIREWEFWKLTIDFLKKAIKKYNTLNHIDLMEELAMNGKPKSLDVYLQIYLGTKKREIDFDTCTEEELKEHCLEDLKNTKILFHFFN